MGRVIGYTQGTFDTLHHGHVRLLKNAKKLCDYLIVGVNSDSLVTKYKHTSTVLKQKERLEIISSIVYVDEAHIVNSLNKIYKAKKFKFNVFFIGDDWKGTARYIKTEKDLKKLGIKIVYLKHTPNISSTYIKKNEYNK